MASSVKLDSSSPVPDEDATTTTDTADDGADESAPRRRRRRWRRAMVSQPMVDLVTRWEQRVPKDFGLRAATAMVGSFEPALGAGSTAARFGMDRSPLLGDSPLLPEAGSATEAVRQLSGLGSATEAVRRLAVAEPIRLAVAANLPSMDTVALGAIGSVGVAGWSDTATTAGAGVSALGHTTRWIDELLADSIGARMAALQDGGGAVQAFGSIGLVLVLPRMFEVAESIAGISAAARLDSLAELVPPELTAVSWLAQQAAQASFNIEVRLQLEMLDAQRAAVEGDEEAVSSFLGKWMDLPRSKWQARVQAGMDVLLLEPVEQCSPKAAFDMLEHLENRVRQHHERGRVPLGETTLRGRPIVHFEVLPALSGETTRPAEEFLPVSPSAEDRAVARLHPVQDARLLAVMGRMTPTECAVILAWGEGRSWPQAATALGLPPTQGETVRAKLKRRSRVIDRAAGQHHYGGNW